MLESITIKKVATCDDTGIQITNLTKVRAQLFLMHLVMHAMALLMEREQNDQQ